MIALNCGEYVCLESLFINVIKIRAGLILLTYYFCPELFGCPVYYNTRWIGFPILIFGCLCIGICLPIFIPFCYHTNFWGRYLLVMISWPLLKDSCLTKKKQAFLSFFFFFTKTDFFFLLSNCTNPGMLYLTLLPKINRVGKNASKKQEIVNYIYWCTFKNQFQFPQLFLKSWLLKSSWPVLELCFQYLPWRTCLRNVTSLTFRFLIYKMWKILSRP